MNKENDNYESLTIKLKELQADLLRRESFY